MKKLLRAVSAEEFRAYCREHGLRVTPQREAIYTELCESGEHPGAERLHALVKPRYPNLSLDTVNRTLLTFARIGLVNPVPSLHGPRRYDPNLEPHHHITCTRCGKIIDFRHAVYNDLEVPPNIRTRYRITQSKVLLTGTCPECQAQ